ncbi:MAG: methyltransferase domain-containing protein [candidate division NC10 bacterium]|nr:methyltransferase domain-containing protein [candidate division NC10 bacterium]
MGGIEFDELKVVQKAYDMMAEEYDILDDRINPFYVNGYKVLDFFVQKLSPRWHGRIVLDVGCGSGLQTVQYAPRAKHVVAIDISGGLMRKVREKLKTQGQTNVTLVQANATNIPLQDCSVDFVSAYGDVIGHIPDYERAIVEMARVCRPGGTVTLEYDNKWHFGLLFNLRELWNALTIRRRGDLRRWTYEYLSHDSKVNLTYKTFTFSEMRSLLHRFGLVVTECAGIHILSSIIPDRIQDPPKERLPLKPHHTRLMHTIAQWDFRLKEIFPFYKVGYSAIVVARKE